MKKLLSQENQIKKEKTSYMTLFCALMMVKQSKATLEQAIGVVPLTGNAKFLAGELLDWNRPPGQPRIKRKGRGRDPVGGLIEAFLRRCRHDSSLQELP